MIDFLSKVRDGEEDSFISKCLFSIVTRSRKYDDFSEKDFEGLSSEDRNALVNSLPEIYIKAFVYTRMGTGLVAKNMVKKIDSLNKIDLGYFLSEYDDDGIEMSPEQEKKVKEVEDKFIGLLREMYQYMNGISE